MHAALSHVSLVNELIHSCSQPLFAHTPAPSHTVGSGRKTISYPFPGAARDVAGAAVSRWIEMDARGRRALPSMMPFSSAVSHHASNASPLAPGPMAGLPVT